MCFVETDFLKMTLNILDIEGLQSIYRSVAPIDPMGDSAASIESLLSAQELDLGKPKLLKVNILLQGERPSL